MVSGHAEATYGPILGSIAPGSLTLVVLMGLSTRAAVADFLRSKGWSAKTPAAILLGASTDDSFVWSGALDGLGSAPIPDDDAPGTLVIGEVVSVASKLRPFLSSPVPASDAGASERSIQWSR